MEVMVKDDPAKSKSDNENDSNDAKYNKSYKKRFFICNQQFSKTGTQLYPINLESNLVHTPPKVLRTLQKPNMYIAASKSENWESYLMFVVLEDGATYRIVSVKDGNALDVAHSKFESGTKVTTYTCHGGENQLWKADIEANGFRLSAAGGKVLPGGMTVLDENVDNCTVSIYQFHGGDNQKWVFQRVDGEDDAYFLENAQTRLLLTSTGCGGQVTTSSCTSDCDQYWRFERVD